VHAQALRETVRGHLDDPGRFALAWDAITEERVAPFYWNQIVEDRVRVARMLAIRDGQEPPAPSPQFLAFQAALMSDADVFRGALEMASCLAFPQEVMARPLIRERIEQVTMPDEPMRLPAPRRSELLQLLD